MPLTWLYNGDFIFFGVWIVAVLITLTIHEFSHALAAKYFGDNTAEAEGRLTLNPIPHIDPLGFFMLLFVGFGWAKPVPVNPNNLRRPRLAMGVVSLAGPVSNLLALIVFGIALKFFTPVLGPANLLINFLMMLVLVNAVLFLFNLLPIPPLDGSKVLFSALPDKYDELKYKFSVNGPWILLALVILDSFSPISIFGWAFNWIYVVLARFLS